MSSESGLPILDISAWIFVTNEDDFLNLSYLSAEQLNICKQWNDYMIRFGYAVLVNHGVENSDFENIDQEARSFFSEPLESKMRYNHGSYGNSNGGYTPPGFEKVALSTGALTEKAKYDPVENFVFTDYPSSFRKANEESLGSPFTSADSYFRKIEKLLRVLHIFSAASLGLDDLHFFQRCYDSSIPGNESLGKNGNALRIAHYPAFDNMLRTCVSAAASGEDFDDLVRYGAHTDYQGFTILKPDPRDWHLVTDTHTSQQIQFGGLEVFLKDAQKWQQVKIPLGMNALVINAGDLIQRWTNDRWHSPLHRVINSKPIPPSSPVLQEGKEGREDEVVGSKDVSRLAIVFFSGPLDECVVSPLPLSSDPNSEGETEPKFAPVKAYDHFLMKINPTNQSMVDIIT